jgi:DNA (cytosine-5)-methyltransferase 1
MVSIAQALTGLPSPSSENIGLPYEIDFSTNWANVLRSATGIVTDHFTQNLTGVQYDRVKELKQGQTMKDLSDHLQHPSFSKRAARRVKDGTPTEKRGGAPSGLKRLKENEPGLTITSAAIREFVHPTENRYLTIRECARIQTFPDDFIFCGCTGDKMQQIGNAIPPLLAEIFARHLYSIDSNPGVKLNTGSLLDFVLTKSKGLSPALKETERQLTALILVKNKEYNLFNNVY